MKINLFIFCIISAAVCSCSKDPVGENEHITFYYEETFCSDPWQKGSTDSITLENVAVYLEEHDLYVGSLSMKQTGEAEVCDACFCKSGKTIYVSTLNNDKMKEEYINLGFKEQ